MLTVSLVYSQRVPTFFLIVALITFFLYENAVCAYASFPH